MIEIAENDIIKLFGEKIALTKDLFKSKEFGRKVQKIIDILNTGINKIEIKKNMVYYCSFKKFSPFVIFKFERYFRRLIFLYPLRGAVQKNLTFLADMSWIWII